MEQLMIKKMHPNAIIPTRGSGASAGADLYACIESEVKIKAGTSEVIPTGIAIGLSDNYSVGLVFGRSGLGINHGITLSNAVGVIDADYRGEIHVGLINKSDKDYTVKPNDRIAQLVIMPVYMPEFKEVEELPETQRGKNGFGSTGR